MHDVSVTGAGEDFIVTTTAVKAPKDEARKVSIDEENRRLLEQAMQDYAASRTRSSVFFEESGTYNSPTMDELARLAECPQDDLAKTMRINSILAKYSNLDDVLGIILESLRVNVNTDYRLNYPAVEGRNKAKTLEKVKAVIDRFNGEIRLAQQIREKIPRAYAEGTVILYLRKSDDGWVIDTYPLGIASISPYSMGGEPIVLVDIGELKNRLSKAAFKTRKGKNLFFESVMEEIRENFPEEVYDAFESKDNYAKLDERNTGVIRIGNNGRKYGLSPMFKSLGASLILETFRNSDMLNAKARSKKVVYQLLNPELLGKNGERNPLVQQQYAHSELLAAYRSGGSVIYTPPAYVKSVDILEPSGEMINKDTVVFYQRKQMTALGIGFLIVESGTSITSAGVSLTQLMRNINAIAESLEDMMHKFYRRVLEAEGLPVEYAPTLKIADAESLEQDLRLKLATFLYSSVNGSLKTTMEILNVDYDEEVARRMAENEAGIDKAFYARESAFTKSKDSGDGENGRPKGDANGKQDYDETYNDVAR